MTDIPPPPGAPRVATRRRVAQERLRGPLVAGVALAVLAGVLLLASMYVLHRSQSQAIDNAVVRATVPFEERFDADDSRYVILLVRPPVEINERTRIVGHVTCDVERADGTSVTVRGGQQGTAIQTDAGETIGTFDATAGTTAVRCALRDGAPRTNARYPLAVAKEEPGATTLAMGLTGAAALAAVIAGGLLWMGLRGRMVVDPATDEP